MRLLAGVLLLAVCVVAFPADSFDDEDDDIDETPHMKPRVAWVPIVQRNASVSDAVGEALLGEREKLGRIGKMLEDSYDQWSRDTVEGDLKIRQLKQRQNSAAATSLSLFFLLSLLF